MAAFCRGVGYLPRRVVVALGSSSGRLSWDPVQGGGGDGRAERRVGEVWQGPTIPAGSDRGVRDDGDGTGLGHLAAQGDGAAIQTARPAR